MRYQLWSLHIEKINYFILDVSVSKRSNRFAKDEIQNISLDSLSWFQSNVENIIKSDGDGMYTKLLESDSIDDLKYSVPWLFI